MSYINADIHFVWATKNRQSLITNELKPLLLAHILENAKRKDIFIDTMNCVSDHIHLLISLGSEYSIKQVAQLIKGESSLWVNRQDIIDTKFGWQDDYFAVSVSPSAIPRVRKYIDYQEEHHKKYSWDEEVKMFLAETKLALSESKKRMFAK